MSEQSDLLGWVFQAKNLNCTLVPTWEMPLTPQVRLGDYAISSFLICLFRKVCCHKSCPEILKVNIGIPCTSVVFMINQQKFMKKYTLFSLLMIMLLRTNGICV